METIYGQLLITFKKTKKNTENFGTISQCPEIRVKTLVSQTFMSRQKQSKMQKVSKTFDSQTKLSQN